MKPLPLSCILTFCALSPCLLLPACEPGAPAAKTEKDSTSAPATVPNPASVGKPVEVAAASAAPAAAVQAVFDPSAIQPTLAQRQLAQWAILGKVLAEQDPTRLSATKADFAFSPTATVNALQALWWGTRGETALEIARLLHSVPEQAGPGAPAPDTSPATLGPAGVPNALGGTVTLQSASSLWLDEKFPVKPDYTTLLTARGLGTVTNVDWSAPAQALGRLNQWASAATGGKIPAVASEGDFQAPVGFVISSVLSFQGAWGTAFDASKTQTADFTLLDGSKRPAGYMTDTREVRSATVENGTQLLELPFADGQHRLIAILPGQPGAAALKDAEQAAIAKRADWQGKLVSSRLTVQLPRFSVTTSCSIKSALQSLGVKQIWQDGEADFSGATATGGLKLDALMHTATILADEKGAQAVAAATGDVTPKGDVTTAEFVANRPFSFLILGDGGQPLFAGRVASPEKK